MNTEKRHPWNSHNRSQFKGIGLDVIQMHSVAFRNVSIYINGKKLNLYQKMILLISTRSIIRLRYRCAYQASLPSEILSFFFNAANRLHRWLSPNPKSGLCARVCLKNWRGVLTESCANAQAAKSADAETFANEPSVGRINNGNPRVRRRHLRVAAAANPRARNMSHVTMPALPSRTSSTRRKSSFVSGSQVKAAKPPNFLADFQRLFLSLYPVARDVGGECALMRSMIHDALLHRARDGRR